MLRGNGSEVGSGPLCGSAPDRFAGRLLTSIESCGPNRCTEVSVRVARVDQHFESPERSCWRFVAGKPPSGFALDPELAPSRTPRTLLESKRYLRGALRSQETAKCAETEEIAAEPDYSWSYGEPQPPAPQYCFLSFPSDSFRLPLLPNTPRTPDLGVGGFHWAAPTATDP